MKQIRKTTWMGTLMLIASAMGMLALYACGSPLSKGKSNSGPKFYIDTVKGDGIDNSIVLVNEGDEHHDKHEGNIDVIERFNDDTPNNTPAVSWTYKKGTRPKYFLVLMYKRGASNEVYYMSLVDGSKSNKEKGSANYVNTGASLEAETNKPVEYRTIVMEITKGDWVIDSDGTITIKDVDVRLTPHDVVSLVRYKEAHYIERTEYEKMEKDTLKPALGANAHKIQGLVGEAVGIPLIRMGTGFTVDNNTLHNGGPISYKTSDETSKYAAAPCVGYLGKSVSPPLEWKGGGGGSKYVVLAYMPMQKNPTGGFKNISQSLPAPYFALWFQYNITTNTLEEGAASNGERYDTNRVTYDKDEDKDKGKLTQNVYSRATNELNSFYNSEAVGCSPSGTTFATRVRYDGPVPAPTTGRHYIRFVVFEVSDDVGVYKDNPSSPGSIAGNRGDSDEPLSNGDAVSGSAVDKLVRNFIDYDRTKVRTNKMKIGTDTVEHKGGDVTIRGVTVLTFPMDAPPAP